MPVLLDPEENETRIRNSGEYKFIIHSDSFEELKSYLAIEWTDAVIPMQVEHQARSLHAETTLLRDFIHIGTLNADK